MTNQQTNKAVHSSSQSSSALPTFMDHVQELKSRLFWVAIFFVVAAAASYPFFNTITYLLLKPLGNHKLYYLSPAGGFSFMIKVCMYAGLIGVLPVIIYHLYKFVAPVMKKEHARAIIVYTLMSMFLALGGIVFAYIISLPAALHFLTDIDVNRVTAMLTIDAYMSFVIAYLIAGALLFQLPLVMLIINSVTPLKPKKLMSFQRHIIIGSFVVAALISPTPDMVNQSLLAAPMVVMYQIGIMLVWSVNRKKTKHTLTTAYHTAQLQESRIKPALEVSSASSESPRAGVLLQEIRAVTAVEQPHSVVSERPANMRRYATQPVRSRPGRRSIDGFAPPASTHRSNGETHLPHTVVPVSARPRTTIDGFIAPVA